MENREVLSKLDEPNLIKVKKPAKRFIGDIVYYVVCIALSLLFLFPLLYMFAASTKTEESIAASAGTIRMFLPDFNSSMFSNYAILMGDYGIWKYAINSFVYAIIVIVLNILVNGLAGYVLAKFRFPGKGFLTFMVLFLIVVPVETSMIPLYSIVKVMLGLKGTLSVFAVILPASISIYNIFLFMSFFQGVPKDYEEAARIDGANRMQVFLKVILPLSKPIVASVSVFSFIGVWNDYVWPTMVLPYAGEGEWSLYPIQAALTSIQSSPDITTGQIMASLVVTSIPIFIIYIVAQKYLIKGFGAAGLKI